MTKIISVKQVVPASISSPRAIIKMQEVLRRQGQIEPLQVRLHCMLEGRPVYTSFEEDAHGADIIHAARNLGWPTLLVVEMGRYER